MERTDKSAYDVLKRNYVILSADLDPTRVANEAVGTGLITQAEKGLICRCVAQDGVAAGVEKFLDLLMLNGERGAFQKFVGVLERQEEFSFWADCLKDEYKKEKEMPPKYDIHALTARTRQLTRSISPLDGATPPMVKKNFLEASVLLEEFKKAKGKSTEEILEILERHREVLKDARDEKGRSLLHLACKLMEYRIVRKLVEDYDFEINRQDANGDTPLHIACRAEKTQSVIFLTKVSGCDPNVKNRNGSTPLHIAARKGPVLLITHLLAMGNLDRSITDKEGRDAISVIRDDPRLAPSLDRKISTASLGSISLMSGCESRKTSVPSMLEGHSRSRRGSKQSEEMVSLLKHSRLETSPEAEDEAEQEREEENPTVVPEEAGFVISNTAAMNGVEDKADGVEATGVEMGEIKKTPVSPLKVGSKWKALQTALEKPEENEVILRDKPSVDEPSLEEGKCSSCCSCCRRRHKGEGQFNSYNVGRLLALWRVFCFLFISFIIGLAVIATLIYFLTKDSTEEAT